MKLAEKLSDAVNSGMSGFPETYAKLGGRIKKRILEELEFTHCPYCGSTLQFHEEDGEDLYGCGNCSFDLCSKQNYQRYVARGVDTSDEFVRDQVDLRGDQ